MNAPVLPICIAHSVGDHGTNNRLDVRTVQILLLMNRQRFSSPHACTVDGHVTKSLNDLIGDFQTQIVKVSTPTRLVQPSSATLLALAAGAPAGLTKEKLHLIVPDATLVNVNKYYQAIVNGMRASQINTPIRIAHFLAQIGHESADLKYSEEVASGSAYEGRASLGNTKPGDGVRFKGRGLIQLTGRVNYTAYGTAKGQDFVSGVNPLKIAHDPNLAVDVSCWFWTQKGLNALADIDDVRGITKRVNGGFNGLALRTARLNRAKYWMGFTQGVTI
ncbi:MAG TPA: glycoside hydrolase family 19 protein [Gemmatimonadaceae bacterium]|nr:glycoside hydrolase family 19 protein [Gemmatimonadaceae bacterium]